MNTETIVGVQVFIFLGYVSTLFALYRLLVSQKDSTIETLRTQCNFLKDRIEAAEKKDPDSLLIKLDQRRAILERELERLSSEENKKREDLQGQITELKEKKQELEDEVYYVNTLLGRYSCPHCSSPLVRRDFVSECLEDDNGREQEVDHEFESYECGYTMVNGAETVACLNKIKNINN